MADESPEAWAERLQEIAVTVMASPELAAPDWDTFGLCSEVSEGSLATTAYRYLGSGPPVSTEPADEVDDLIWDLWDASRAAGGTWEVLLLKLERVTGRVDVRLVSGPDVEPLRITPATMDALPERLRPRPEHFAQRDRHKVPGTPWRSGQKRPVAGRRGTSRAS